ncbi:SH3 domain protein [Trichostrongylus colubriformis]|uniref:SH3 domain protein n=1 Tax=Trichostrongylus colubriformis TaxID=6319 RepID=A0AAN8IIT3_TRICO
MAEPATQAAPFENKMAAAYDYSSVVAGDSEFKMGNTVEVIACLDQDWIRGRQARHFFHGSLGETGRTVAAIADHSSDDPKMYFSKGDRIIIVEDASLLAIGTWDTLLPLRYYVIHHIVQVDSYWYRGKVEGFKTFPPGLFPKAFVKED